PNRDRDARRSVARGAAYGALERRRAPRIEAGVGLRRPGRPRAVGAAREVGARSLVRRSPAGRARQLHARARRSSAHGQRLRSRRSMARRDRGGCIGEFVELRAGANAAFARRLRAAAGSLGPSGGAFGGGIVTGAHWGLSLGG